jgi:ferritin-like metal-binding protein YciE
LKRSLVYDFLILIAKLCNIIQKLCKGFNFWLFYLCIDKIKLYRNLNPTDMKNASPDAAKNMRELFIMELRDIYWCENALTKAIPKSIDNCSSQELIDALTEHLNVTNHQIDRLNQVFESIGLEPKGKKCEAMDGILREAEEIMEETKEGPVRDAAIVSAMQKVEHYEIASYGTLRSFANSLGENEAASLLEETLNEEKEADAKLTQLAESKINIEAE